MSTHINYKVVIFFLAVTCLSANLTAQQVIRGDWSFCEMISGHSFSF